MTEETFTPGEKVIATCSYAHQLTEGKTYTVVRYESSVVDPTFTWPAYVTVIGDLGNPVTGHTYRVKKQRATE